MPAELSVNFRVSQHLNMQIYASAISLESHSPSLTCQDAATQGPIPAVPLSSRSRRWS